MLENLTAMHLLTNSFSSGSASFHPKTFTLYQKQLLTYMSLGFWKLCPVMTVSQFCYIALESIYIYEE